MKNIYSPSDVVWIKNVTNSDTGRAYMELDDDEFILHFPTHHKSNVIVPNVNDIILIFQNIDGNRVFTHLVSPLNSLLVDENVRSRYRYGRQVKIIAKTNVEEVIPISNTLWNNVNFQGISQGNACKIENIKYIQNVDELQFDIWQRFTKYFTHDEKESVDLTNAALNEITDLNPDITVAEGSLKLVTHFVRERNKEVVKQKKMYAIQNNLLKCEVCEFSFKQKYDAIYIECHHLIPIGKPGIRETKLDDLSLVCSNCHRMLHKKFDGNYLTIEELRERILKSM